MKNILSFKKFNENFAGFDGFKAWRIPDDKRDNYFAFIDELNSHVSNDASNSIDAYNDPIVIFNDMTLFSAINQKAILNFMERIGAKDVTSMYEKVNEKKAYKLNQKDYEFYVVNTKNNKIAEGFEYQEDAKDRMKEIHEESDGLTKGQLKVWTKKSLKSKGIDPDDNANWKDVNWHDEANAEKAEDKKED